MATYRTPGVYVEEINVFPPSVVPVETAIPAFVGFTEKVPAGYDATDPKAFLINSLSEYEAMFGTTTAESFTFKVKLDAVTGAAEITQTAQPDASAATFHNLYYSLQHYFANGGGKCYIVSVGLMSSGNVTPSPLALGVDAVAPYDEPTIIVVPESGLLADADYKTVLTKIFNQVGDKKDRFGIIDVNLGFKVKALDANAQIKKFRDDNTGVNNLKYVAAYFPWLLTTMNFIVSDKSIKFTADSDNPFKSKTFDDLTGAAGTPKIRDAYPTVYNNILSLLRQQRVLLPPSPAMAGLYCFVDRTRGVWKAPANVSVSNVVMPTFKIDNNMNDGLNMDVTGGKSINAIREFPGKGLLVWGARTLAGNDNEWRYIPVRRLFNMMEESIQKALGTFVFEPNDANTWVKVKAMIENFLSNLWRDGALMGAKPEDAFKVQVGFPVTMTQDDILNGYMNVYVAVAPVRPAEFIVLKFSQKMLQS